MTRLSVLLLAALALLPAPAAAQVFPLFDSHIHYSRPDWDAYTPERILSILAKAGVRRALVSSTPDDGTLKLYEKARSGEHTSELQSQSNLVCRLLLEKKK